VRWPMRPGIAFEPLNYPHTFVLWRSLRLGLQRRHPLADKATPPCHQMLRDGAPCSGRELQVQGRRRSLLAQECSLSAKDVGGQGRASAVVLHRDWRNRQVSVRWRTPEA